MEQYQHRRKTGLLLALIAVAAGYGFWFQQRQVLTGNPMVDGTLCVLLGLYICSRPAGNAIDLFFFERSPFHRMVTEWSSIRWLVLNILTLLMGWIVIYLGTTHLMSQAE
ncbi:MAG TPA: hypothetical protein VGK77_05220 [Candidatus Binatia bacterium]|jgi:hypothetical protein